MKKFFLCLCLVVATGYVLDYATKAMNMPYDAAYVGGIIGIFVWSWLVVIVVRKYILKGWNYEGVATERTVNTPVNDDRVSMDNKDRTGDGGNRS